MFFVPIFFVFGLIVGSFLNVVVLRLNTGRSIIRGRSQCFACGKTLSWLELLPVLSFLIQRGRCKSCGGRIAWQYPAVELATGILFALVAWRFDSPFVLGTLLTCVSLLIAILVYDLRHKIIPDILVFLFIALALIFNLLVYGNGTFSHYFSSPDFLAGPILFGAFGFLWLVSGGKWMGLGDAKLVLGLGWLLGASATISAMLIAFWSGSIVGLTLLYLKPQSLTMKSEIPFAPFLILGSLVPLFFNLTLF